MTKVPEYLAAIEFEHRQVNHVVALEYQQLEATVRRNFDARVWHMTDACLSVLLSLTLKDQVNPIGLNLVDGPASEKTTVLSFFYGLPFVYRSDDFTPASFVTQAANVKKKEADKIDLLPRIQHKCLIVPELAPIFGADREELLQNFAILTRVFDGEGLWRDGAVQGRRGYEGDYFFVWLGATVPIKSHVWKIMGSLGSRFLFLSIPSAKSQEDDIHEAVESVLGDNTYASKREKCQSAVRQFLETFQATLDPNSFARTIRWNGRLDDKVAVRRISEMAALTARVRSDVNVWMSDAALENPTCDFSSPILERPMRLMAVLIGLARGHAIAAGRRNVSCDELPLITSIAFSSMPEDRRRVLELVIERDHPEKASRPGAVTSSEITEILSFSKPTAIKILRTLEVLKVGHVTGGVGALPLTFTLASAYSWFCTDEFLQLRSSWHTGTDLVITDRD